MIPAPDFDRLEVYQALAGITTFIQEIHDRFPEDELPILYDRMRVAAVEAGAHLASGFARDGLDGRGLLSDTTQREVGGKLSALRHYILTAASEFIIDEQHVFRFEALYGRAKESLCSPAGPR